MIQDHLVVEVVLVDMLVMVDMEDTILQVGVLVVMVQVVEEVEDMVPPKDMVVVEEA